MAREMPRMIPGVFTGGTYLDEEIVSPGYPYSPQFPRLKADFLGD
jgi:hypothetical protein